MDSTFTPESALNAAIAIIGGQGATARLCGVSQPSVWKWVNRAKRLPLQQVPTVSQATGIAPYWFAPDHYPRDLPPFPAESPIPNGVAE